MSERRVAAALQWEAEARGAISVRPAVYPSEYPRTWPNADYQHYYTFNDNTHRDCINTMLDAYHRTGKREFLDAAKREVISLCSRKCRSRSRPGRSRATHGWNRLGRAPLSRLASRRPKVSARCGC